MIRLGTTSFWLEPSSTGWWLVRVHPRPKQAERFGPFTSPRHVLQQKAVELPKGARRDLEAFVKATSAGDDLLDELPPVSPP